MSTHQGEKLVLGDASTWYEWIKIAAFAAGIVFGGFAVSSVSWVWIQRTIFTVGAGWLATLGTVMITASIWQTVEIEGVGFKARLAELEANQTEAVAALQEVIDTNKRLIAAANRRTMDLAPNDPLLSRATGRYDFPFNEPFDFQSSAITTFPDTNFLSPFTYEYISPDPLPDSDRIQEVVEWAQVIARKLPDAELRVITRLPRKIESKKDEALAESIRETAARLTEALKAAGIEFRNVTNESYGSLSGVVAEFVPKG